MYYTNWLIIYQFRRFCLKIIKYIPLLYFFLRIFAVDMRNILKVDNPNDYARFVDAPVLHPLVSIIHYDVTRCQARCDFDPKLLPCVTKEPSPFCYTVPDVTLCEATNNENNLH